MAKGKLIKLGCGIEAQSWSYQGNDYLRISIIDFFNGHGDLSSFELMGRLFSEIHEMGYQNTGMSRVIGYYDSTDDVFIDAIKFNKK